LPELGLIVNGKPLMTSVQVFVPASTWMH
jgi:hypothetical protein